MACDVISVDNKVNMKWVLANVGPHQPEEKRCR